MTGKVIAGRYKITGYLRDGRMGSVYSARRAQDDARVAVKLLEPSLLDNREVVKRFQRETRVTKRIHSPYCLAVLDAGKEPDGQPYLVLEYCIGERLVDLIEERNRLDVAVAAKIAAEVALALEAAHAVGIIHRDLSPDNIMIVPGDDTSTTKVLDFGLARLADGASEEDTSLTAVGVRVGNPAYMAPEYIQEFELDHRADLYALGCVLFEMIVGEPPFKGRAYKLLDLHINGTPPVPSAVVPGTPAWVDDLVAELLAKSPDKRPHNARAVVERLQQGTGIPYGKVAAPAEPQRLHEAPAPTQRRAISQQDVLLTRFIEDRIGNVFRKGTAPPDPRECLVVERVASKCIAAQVGLVPGALLHLPDAPRSHGMIDPRIYNVVQPKRNYKFYLPQTKETLSLETSGVHIGVELMRSVDHIKAHYDVNDADPLALYEIWKQGDWATLEALAYKTLVGAGRGIASGLFAKLIGNEQIKQRNTPALLFYGAALVENGRGDDGWPFIHEFKSHYSTHWPDLYRALATAYLGLHRIQAGHVAHGLSLLQESWLLHPIPKVSDAISRTSGQPHDTRLWYGLQFPDYDLNPPNSNASVHLGATLNNMGDAQIAIVIMLGGFRGNAAYDDFMRRYLNYGAYFADFIGAVHLVTTKPDRLSDRDDWFVGEDMARQSGLPFAVLEDYRAFVQREVKPPVIPTIYALNHEGLVVHEGQLFGSDLWDALALVGQIRLKRSQSRA